MTKQLLALAAMAVFATFAFALLGCWHPKSYTVVQGGTTFGNAGAVALVRQP
jgi:hypothetical protein